MRCVLYSQVDGEPITVVDLPSWAVDVGLKHGQFSVAVMMPLHRIPLGKPDVHLNDYVRQVDIAVHKLPARHYLPELIILTTRNEEAALLLRPELLPGQQQLAKELFEKGFGAGIIAALQKLAG